MSMASSRISNDRGFARRSTPRPQTGRSRPRTSATSTGYADNEIICAISEARGLPPTIGLSFLNITTSEAVLCQFADTQTYARTCHKIAVFCPSDVLYADTTVDSNLVSIISENLKVESNDVAMTGLPRKYWCDGRGHEYIQRLAFPDDVESLKTLAGGNFFATCCFAAAMSFAEMAMNITFAPQTLRVRFESSEGTMMIDLSTIASLELIQNLKDIKSKHSLYGLMNECLTKMGERTLRSNLLQPSTDATKIQERFEAVQELTSREETFFAVREALSVLVDTDRCLSSLVKLPVRIDFEYMEQSVNNVLMLKSFVDAVRPLWQAMAGATTEGLRRVRDLCAANNYQEVEELIKYALNDDVSYTQKSVELRNQRVFAIRTGVNGFLDVARTTFKEINQDVHDMIAELGEANELNIDLKFDPARHYYLRIAGSEFEAKPMPEILINVVRRKQHIECQTLDLMKMNQKLRDAHNEVISMSDKSVQELIDNIRTQIQPLFRISEAIGLLDMLAAFAQLTTLQEYTKPELTAALAIKAGRHPIREKIQSSSHKYIPNDVYATPQHRFQIITGCNNSGKSNYIRSIALTAVMAQTGCFVPATYASTPVFHQLFARVSTDSAVEANVSTFAAEMRDIAHILRNIEPRSLVIVDELGRGTSTTDGLAIAIAIAEALIESGAFVWFVTHFRDLPRILAERAGVVNLHLSVNFSRDEHAEVTKMKMTYKISDGPIPAENQFYGLALAKAICLPERVVEVATQVSEALNERNEARKSEARALAVVRKRRLILGLKEQLDLARDSQMEGRELRLWLKSLRDEFLVRMEAVEREAEGFDPEEDEHVPNESVAGDAGIERNGGSMKGAQVKEEDDVPQTGLTESRTHPGSDTSRQAGLIAEHVRIKHEKLDRIATRRQYRNDQQQSRHFADAGGSIDEAIVID